MKTAILNKILAIQKEIKPMEKEGRNTTQGYAYLSDEQIIVKVKELMDKHNVVCKIDAVETGIQNTPKGTQLLTSVLATYTFYDCDSGEEISGTMPGQGTDANDKGVYKAITGATKYVYVKTFKIATGDDPEKEESTPKRIPPKAEVKDPTDDWKDINAWPEERTQTASEDNGLETADHFCLIHNVAMKERTTPTGGHFWDHRAQLDENMEPDKINGKWFMCDGKHDWRPSQVTK
jgi:hypothetical protein